MSSENWRLFCLDVDVLIAAPDDMKHQKYIYSAHETQEIYFKAYQSEIGDLCRTQFSYCKKKHIRSIRFSVDFEF